MKYPDLGPFLSMCHERQYDGDGCKHGEREAMMRCRQCMVEVGDELAAQRYVGERDAIIEECVKVIDRKGQDLTNEYCHGDAGPDGYTWTNKEAEWQVILLGELIDEFRALKRHACEGERTK